ncbi:MAG: T9SS type A sorting domain-containing protein [candidate division WOR-3 bacterium]
MILLFLLTTLTREIIAADSHHIDASIALDSTGNSYILVFKGFQSLHTGYLHLYYKNNGNWLVDTIESNNVVYEGDLVISRDGCVWCSYTLHCDTISYFIVAHRDSIGWIKDTVGIRTSNQAASFWGSMITTDSSGVPHITYIAWATFDPEKQVVYHTFLKDSIWQKEIVDSCYNASPIGSTMDIDTQNHIHMSYFLINPSGVKLMYTQKIESNWYYTIIDSMYYPPYSAASIKINPVSDFPSVVYQHTDPYELLYKYYNGTSWITDVVHPLSIINSEKALDFDSLGNPRLSCDTPTGSCIAYKDSLGWHEIPFPPLPPPLNDYYAGGLRVGPHGTIHTVARAVDWNTFYNEIHYIYGTIEPGIEEDERLKVKGERLNLMVWPNAVRDNAQIQCAIPERQRISLNLYDIVGRKVKTITEGTVDTGVYSYRLDSSDLGSGVYFVILEGERESKREKILIVR